MMQSAATLNPIDLLHRFRNNRHLIWQMIRRNIIGRYRGSMFGMLWSFLNPLFMLSVYTLVFSVVFPLRWGDRYASQSKTKFAIILFAGLIIYNLFAEVISRAPDLIVINVNYVKKVVFPLEILPIVDAGSALFHACVSTLILLLFQVAVNLSIPYTAIFLPMILLPFLLLLLGVSWFLAALGVYVRDIAHPIGILITAALFISPVLYPASALPEPLRVVFYMNPLTFIIEQTRDVLIWTKMPNWGGLILYTLVSLIIAGLGLYWFQRTRKGFADVL